MNLLRQLGSRGHGTDPCNKVTSAPAFAPVALSPAPRSRPHHPGTHKSLEPLRGSHSASKFIVTTAMHDLKYAAARRARDVFSKPLFSLQDGLAPR